MSSTTTIPAIPAKLPSGAWGARVKTAEIAVGDVVTITTRSGKSWNAKVTRVARPYNGGSTVVETESLDRRPASRSRSRNWDPTAFNGYGAPRGGFRRACVTDGNCSSFGSGRSCGGHDCDGY